MVSVHIASVGGEPMMEVAQAQAVIGSGLAGDRYAEGVGTYSKKQGPDREVTLIEIEAIEALVRDHDIKLDVGQSRRNIVTRGVPLNHLVGAEFQVGGVKMRGVRLNEPCKYFENLLDRGPARRAHQPLGTECSSYKRGLHSRGRRRQTYLNQYFLEIL